MKWIRYGPDAVLVEHAKSVGKASFEHGQAIVEELERHPPHDLAEVVPAFTRILVRFHPRVTADLPARADELIRQLKGVPRRPQHTSDVKQIPAIYDGADLETLAETRGLSVNEVIELHSRPVYRVHLLGFAPGFPYLGKLNPRLHTPRKSTPRTLVKGGSIAIGGEHTGIYPGDSPGGWHIIARTTTALFDNHADREYADERKRFFLRSGDQVRFVPVDD